MSQDKIDKIAALALRCNAVGRTLKPDEMAKELNSMGVMTEAGTPYTGWPRAMLKVAQDTFAALEKQGRQAGMDAVANVFRDTQGRRHWELKR